MNSFTSQFTVKRKTSRAGFLSNVVDIIYILSPCALFHPVLLNKLRQRQAAEMERMAAAQREQLGSLAQVNY